MKGLRRNRDRSAGAIETKIESVLERVAPLLRIEHCRLEIAAFDPPSGELTIRIAGTCPDCAGSPAMFAAAIEAHVKQRVTEVSGVRIES